jgi:fructose-bisphosphate aldolase class 1
MKTWSGKKENVSTAQAALHHRAHANSLAASGKYQESMG